jgi:hypothetical protein
MTARILAALAVVPVALAIAGCGRRDVPAAAPPASAAPAQAPAVPGQPSAAPGQAVAMAAQPAAPVPAAPVPGAARTPAHAGQLRVAGFGAQVPPGWNATEPSSSMRIAQFSVPGAGSAEAGEAAVFFFPSGQGGNQNANIERWASQFTGADGKPVAPKVSTARSGGNEITLVELQGNYARGVGVGQEGDARPNQTLLVAMVETPAGRITLQLYGSSATVAAQRDRFLELAAGWRRA